MERLKGTVALVTGASSGIGEETARQLAAEGAAVALVARRTERLNSLAEEIRQKGGQALVLTVDVRDQKQAIHAVEETVKQFGQLDIVINNAGTMLLSPISGADTEEWERMIDINLKGLLYILHAAIPHLKKAAAGPRNVADLVNISSIAGRIARAGSGVYNLTKFGVTAVSESLRQELAPAHVRVSSIEPGVVATELIDQMKPEARQASLDRFKGITKLESSDVAEAIVFTVTRNWRTAINEVLIRPTEQTW